MDSSSLVTPYSLRVAIHNETQQSVNCSPDHSPASTSQLNGFYSHPYSQEDNLSAALHKFGILDTVFAVTLFAVLVAVQFDLVGQLVSYYIKSALQLHFVLRNGNVSSAA
eukprot:gene4282-6599_t